MRPPMPQARSWLPRANAGLGMSAPRSAGTVGALGALAGVLAGASAAWAYGRWRASLTLSPGAPPAPTAPAGQLFGLDAAVDIAALVPAAIQASNPSEIPGRGQTPNAIVRALTKTGLMRAPEDWPTSFDALLSSCRTTEQVQTIRSELSVVIASRRVLDNETPSGCDGLSLVARNLYNLLAGARLVGVSLPYDAGSASLYEVLVQGHVQTTIVEADADSRMIQPRFIGDAIVPDARLLSAETLQVFGDAPGTGLYFALEDLAWRMACSLVRPTPPGTYNFVDPYLATESQARSGFASLAANNPAFSAADRARIAARRDELLPRT